MPFFFDLSSLVPVVDRNPFEPLAVPDAPIAEPIGENEELLLDESAAKPLLEIGTDDAPLAKDTAGASEPDFGLPIPEHYDFDMMRAMCQDPFRLFVYWQLKDNPFDRLQKIFPPNQIADFHSVLKLIDETTNISVFFNAAFTNEYWFSVFPDRRYRVELGVRSPRHGYIKLLTSQAVQTPRGGPSDQAAPEEHYHIETNEFLEVLRDSHLVPERMFTIEELLPGAGDVPAGVRNAAWESLPGSFRRLVQTIADIQAGRDFEHWWERLSVDEQGQLVREFLDIISQMAGTQDDGEMGYMLLLRYLPELLRRSILSEAKLDQPNTELLIDKPISLYLAEQLGQPASEITPGSSSDNAPQPPFSEEQSDNPSHALWLPSLNSHTFSSKSLTSK